MVDVDKLSDEELRTKLLEFGFPVMPITGTTRKVMAKKLKMLLENKNKINSEGGRRSLGKYSSEEESDTDLRSSKKKDNRRVTMAAPIMQPPSSNIRIRKSTRLTDVSEPEISGSPIKKDIKTTTTTSRTQRIIKTAQDDFDTGSDSESDIITNSYSPGTRGIATSSSSFDRNSPIKSSISSSYSLDTNKYSPRPMESSYSSAKNVSFNANVSPGRLSNYNSPSLASEYATDRLNQIRSRLSLNNSGYEQPAYNSPSSEKEETPFLSNFTKRLTALSSQKNDYDYKNDIIKEHDTNGSSNYMRNQLSSFRTTRGRDSYNYKTGQSNILKNNIVSFAVLGFAALFFIALAIVYLGMRSDTSVVPAGTVVPHCIHSNPMTKKGVNCVTEEDLSNAIHLLNAVKPELQKRAIANKCFDATLKAHMTEPEIVSFLKTNFAIKDDEQIKNDLLNLEILTFSNPEWGINVVQTEDNNGQVSTGDLVENMEKVIFNYKTKLTSLVMFNPDLPWKCTFYNTFASTLKGLLIISIFFGFFYSLNFMIKYYKHYEQKQKDEIGFMVEKIIDILQSNGNEENDDNFVVINHVRDMILPVADRKKKEKSWVEAVKFINENESRVRTEVQVVKGEPFEVWRWIGSANLSTSGNSKETYRNSLLNYIQLNRDNDAGLYTFRFQLSLEPNGTIKTYRITIKMNEKEEETITCHECIASNGRCKHAMILLRWLRCQVEDPILTQLADQRVDKIDDIVPKIISTDREKQIERLPQTLSLMSLSMHQLILNFAVTGSHSVDDFIVFASKNMPLEACQEVVNLTHNQAEEDLWHKMRYGRITASRLLEAACCKTENGSLVRQIIGVSKIFNTKAMERGRNLESEVLREVEKNLKQHFDKTGLFLIPNYPMLGASPDAISEGFVVEVKCPMTESTFVSYLNNGEIGQKYKAQIHLQMLAANKKKGLFCVADPDFETNKKVSIVWVYYDAKFINTVIDKAIKFWKSCVFVHLLEACKLD